MIKFLKKNWLIIIGAIIVLVYVFFFSDTDMKDDIESDTRESQLNIIDHDEEESQKVIVDVKGEVKNPGVYEVDISSRVNDVIILAGGFTEIADEFPVNLAQKVHDEMTIIVPKVGTNEDDYHFTGDKKVRINYATQEEIETLNGIGPSKAQAIIKYREENGFFQKVEDLLEISGIGEKTLENMKEDIQIP